MTLLFVIGFAAIILAGVALGYSRLASAADSGQLDESWYLEFDPQRYAVLARLASDTDLRVAREWAGMDKGLEKRLRRQRARAFYAYLSEMRADFLRLETVGRLMVLSGNTTLEFRQKLVEAKLQFSAAWWQVRVQYFVWQLGLGRIQPGKLVAAFDRFVAVTGPMVAAPGEA